MRIRFYNARILTLADDLSIIENGELITEDGRISYVGKAGLQNSSRAEKPYDREIDARGNLLMPGFKNCHTHSAMTFLRSNADDMKLQNRSFPMKQGSQQMTYIIAPASRRWSI